MAGGGFVTKMAGGGVVTAVISRNACTTRLPAAKTPAEMVLLVTIGMKGMERLSSTTKFGWRSWTCSIVAKISIGSQALATITLPKTTSVFSLEHPRASTTCTSLWRQRSPAVSTYTTFPPEEAHIATAERQS